MIQQQSAERLRVSATKCRDLASTSMTQAARDVLDDLADDYERKAVDLEQSNARHPRRRPAFTWSLE
jgi:hypothetical protein